MNNNFYYEFEEKFRGDREKIKERLKVYLPFVLPLKSIYSNGTCIDLGCGRGEWLELLKENQIDSVGIDLDQGMLEDCKKYELSCQYGNGIDYLQTLKTESVIVVSAFHIIEHLSYKELQVFIAEAYRVLKPGGILIIETPNPENLKVSTENFYLDMTHKKPIPSTLLAFLVEYNEFSRVKILRLNENKNTIHKKNIELADIIYGVSPDYAVVGQKYIATKMFLFDEPFVKEYGISLEKLVRKFDERLNCINKLVSFCRFMKKLFK